MPEAPLKPDRPLASLVFSDTGKVRKSIEGLPRTQKDLELAVAKKFGGAVAKFQGIDLKVEGVGEAQADIHCSTPEDSSIGVQITEVVDPLLIQLQEQRHSYRDCLLADYDALLSEFSGCRLSIVDNGHEPLLPKIATGDGVNAVTSLSASLAEFAESIEDLAVRYLRSMKAEVVGVNLSFVCERFRPKSESSGYALEWSGARCFLPEHQRDFLTMSIKKKLDKHYAPTENTLWLLAYSTDVLRTADDQDVDTARTVLASTPHPFDKAWYFYPYSEHDYGHLLLLWEKST